MPQGPLITDEIKVLAAKLHKEHPKWTNSMIRNEILQILHRADKSLPKDWPSKYSIDRIMPGIRERMRLSKLNPDPRDNPWTIQSMVKYPIPPEALPSVLEVWFFARDNDKFFNIRDAQWAARLYAAIKDTESLYGYSRLMALQEKVARDAGIEDFMGSEAFNLYLFSTMTGHVITREEDKRIAGMSEEIRRQMRVVKAQMLRAKIPGTRVVRLGIHHWEFEETEASQKEAKNERKHKAKRQK